MDGEADSENKKKMKGGGLPRGTRRLSDQTLS